LVKLFVSEMPHGHTVRAREAAAFICRRDIRDCYGTFLVAVDGICHWLGRTTLGYPHLLLTHSCL